MSGWVVAAVAALWLIRVGVLLSRWYWRREVERLSPPVATARSHVSLRAEPFDQDRSG